MYLAPCYLQKLEPHINGRFKAHIIDLTALGHLTRLSIVGRA